jgi:hypothetical protein
MAIAKFSNTKVKVNLGFLSIEGNWEIDEIQRNAAWEMYVELSTRITTSELKENEGLLREALNSLYSLFATTRGILKKYGPIIATPGNPNDTTFGHLAVGILNKILRPTLAKWHPQLLDWEHQKPVGCSVTEHEANWKLHSNLRTELNEVRLKLIEYANVLGVVSGVANLIEDK